MKVFMAQLFVQAGKPEENFETIRVAVERGKAVGADLVLLPQNAIEGSTMLGSLGDEVEFLQKCGGFRDKVAELSQGIEILLGGSDMLSDGGVFFSKGKPAKWGYDFEVLSGLSTFTEGKNLVVRNACAGHAQKLQWPIFYLDLVGTENSGKNIYAMDGGSGIWDKNGNQVFAMPRFESSECLVEVGEDGSVSGFPQNTVVKPGRIALIHDALVFMIRENLKKFHIPRMVIGASGGIDSAVSAALYAEAIGAKNVYLINMPTRFNSATTRNAAADLAKNLGSPYMVAPISAIVESVCNSLGQCKFEGDDTPIKVEGINHENLQARTRSASVLLTVASVLGAGITCNGNKSEATAGYCTLYGDSCGVMCALGDLWKTDVYALARYINREREIIPQASIDVPASAELSDAMNVDEGKGDPIKYPYHDKLFAEWVEWGSSLESTEARLAAGFESYCKDLGVDLEYFNSLFKTPEEALQDMRAWHRRFRGIALAKRIQFPPILSVSGHAFGAEYPESQV